MMPAESVSVASVREAAPPPLPPAPVDSAATATEPMDPLPVPSPTPSPTPIPIPTMLPSPTSGAPFDRGAAAMALGSVNVRTCAQSGGPKGTGHVTVTFANDGGVLGAVIDGGPFPGTAVGGCVAQQFRSIRVPPFSGATVRVGKSFFIQ